MSTNTHDYFYDLPESLIAQTPASPRDSSRLLTYDRLSGETGHGVFSGIINYLNAGDVVVVNNTRVLPVRLRAKKATGGAMEFLLLKRAGLNVWQTLVKPGRKAVLGARFDIEGRAAATVVGLSEEGTRLVRFDMPHNGAGDALCDSENERAFIDFLNESGEMPLPHYIKTVLSDNARYNTVYSKVNGSAAAPTAGLHFTKGLIEALKNKGVIFTEVLLHVGLGTFRPVKSSDVTGHKMHSEYYEISAEAAAVINLAKEQNRRVIAVGTTSVRVLESAAQPLFNNAESADSADGGTTYRVQAQHGDTDIFIYPPYRFKIVDALITNFHLPESTLIMLVSAFCNREEVLNLYNTAITEKYRFYSFGDAMFIY